MNKGKFSERKETEYPGQLHFHYNRDERQAVLSPEVVERYARKRGIFRGNRPLVILFLDVLFVLILYFIISPILHRYAAATDLNGYELRLRAFLFENATYVSVQIEAEEAAAAGEQNLVTIRFSIEDADSETELVDVLPGSPGEVMMYRARLPGGKGKQNVFADVRIGCKTAVLKTGIIPEQD
jgi:hypothetical protein